MKLLNPKYLRFAALLLPFLVLFALALSIGTDGGRSESKPFARLTDADKLVAEQAAKVREIAWNRISPAGRKTVIGDWQAARVETQRWTAVPFSVGREIGRSTKLPLDVYKVTFRTRSDAMLGPIVMYFDQETFAYLAEDIRD